MTNRLFPQFNHFNFVPRTLIYISLSWTLPLVLLFLGFGIPNFLGPETAASTDLPQGVQNYLAKASPFFKIIGGLALLFALSYTGWQFYWLLHIKRWQAEGNIRLAQVGVVAWLSVPASEENPKWTATAEMWQRFRTPLLTSEKDLLSGKALHASLEVVVIEGDGVYWLLWSPDPRKLADKYRSDQDLSGTLGGAVSGYNPKARVKLIDDPLLQTLQTSSHLSVLWLLFGLARPSHYPINMDFGGDPMMALVANMNTNRDVHLVGLQTLFRPVNNWQAAGQQELSQIVQTQADMSVKKISKQAKAERLALEAKLDQFGFDTYIRIFAAGSNPQALSQRLRALRDVMGQYQGLNSFVVVAQGQDELSVVQRAFPPQFDPKNILNVGELAALYHLPSKIWEPIPGIKWSPAREIPPAAGAIREWGWPDYLKSTTVGPPTVWDEGLTGEKKYDRIGGG